MPLRPMPRSLVCSSARSGLSMTLIRSMTWSAKAPAASFKCQGPRSISHRSRARVQYRSYAGAQVGGMEPQGGAIIIMRCLDRVSHTNSRKVACVKRVEAQRTTITI